MGGSAGFLVSLELQQLAELGVQIAEAGDQTLLDLAGDVRLAGLVHGPSDLLAELFGGIALLARS